MARGKYKRRRMLKARRLITLQDSELSSRIVKILEEYGIHNMAELDMTSERELKNITGIGEKALEEIRQKRMEKGR